MTEILVLGAGMVGVSTALALQGQGHAVTLIDRRAPGRETSFGNAGLIQAEAAEPYAIPRDLATLFAMATERSNDVTWRFSGLRAMAPALWSYFLNSAPRRHAAISRLYAKLTARSTEDHAPLIAAAGAEDLMTREGMAELYRTPRAFDAAARNAERIGATYGVTFRLLDGEGFRAEEPALTCIPAGGVIWDQSWSCADPGGLVARYAALFARRGGRIVTGDAMTLRREGKGWGTDSAEGPLGAEEAVIALGPWAPALLARLGHPVRMIWKRGYHGHFETPRPLRRPIVDGANGVVAGSMRQGLRITTGAQLVRMEAPADTRQLTRGERAVGEFLSLGPRIAEKQWFGTRPCLPDMLPMVGPLPGEKGIWVNFGHGHQGFTLGPTTARLLAAAHETGDARGLEGLAPGHRL